MKGGPRWLARTSEATMMGDEVTDQYSQSDKPSNPPGRKTDRTNGPRIAPLAEPIVISEWKKNRAGDTIRLTLKSYEGHNIVDLRTWFSRDGKRLPGRGFSCSIRQLPTIADAMTAACASARDLGLIENGDAE